MDIKKLLTGFIAIIIIFVSYYVLKPMNSMPPPNLTDYRLYTYNIFPSNPSAAFQDQGKGTFFIHPGVQKPSGGIFTFNKSGKVILSLSILKGSKVGDIEFTVKNNGQTVKKLIITAQQQHETKLRIPVDRMDTIEIWADKHGDTVADWGHLEIKIQESHFDLKNFIIPFLLSLLFIYLLAKDHLYIAINSYLTFILILTAEKVSFGTMSFESVMYYTIFIFSSTFLFVFIYQELNILKKYKIATIFSFIVIFLIYGIPLAIIMYTYNFNHSITAEILFAVFQTNKSESLEFVTSSVDIKYIMIFISITLFVAIMLYLQELKETKRIEKSLLLFMIITLFTIFTMGYPSLRLPNFILEKYTDYNLELQKLMHMRKKREAGKINFHATKKEKGETYVLVIGESLNKYNMSIYGYMRDTTPRLNKLLKNNNMILFNNAYPNYTQTMLALSLALTEANQYNKKKYFDSLSLVNIFNKAGFDTYWITNQILLSDHDTMISILAYDAKHLIPLNHHHGMESVMSFDGKSIKALTKALSENENNNKLIIIHLEGSHFYYQLRYPHDKFSKYKNKLSPLEFGKFYQNKEINDYDNSVFYNDYVVNGLLKTLKQQSGATALLYFSDHAEDVLRGFKHHTPNLTPEMSQIPMLVWLSKDYKEKYKEKYKVLASNKNNLFSNDMIYDTLIGLANIDTDRYNSIYDFSSKKYNLKAENALFLHGKKYYAYDSNYIYWRDENSRYLNDTNQTDKISIKNVNTIGKYSEIKFNRLNKSFIVDMYYDNEKLYIGTKDKHIQYALQEYLEKISLSNINNLYIDMTNINEENSNTILTRLENINSLYHLKDKVILIFDRQDIKIDKFKTNNWVMSYKLNKNAKDINWDQLRLWLKKYDIPFINMDSNTYHSSNKELKGLSIMYNIDVNSSLKNKNFKNNLILKKLYDDNKINTILIDFPSLYEL